ncbi:MAG TPA: hypothetical protein VGD26_02955 [Chitinophagaceae bacterium]|jgi:hypothetical protein
MKNILSVLVVSLFLFAKTTVAQTSDSIVNALLAINESQYINKPLDSIISVLPSGYTSMKIYGSRNTARALMVTYPNKVWIELHVREFTHMNPEDRTWTWNQTLMKKEKLYKSLIQKKDTCYRNCDIVR